MKPTEIRSRPSSLLRPENSRGLSPCDGRAHLYPAEKLKANMVVLLTDCKCLLDASKVSEIKTSS